MAGRSEATAEVRSAESSDTALLKPSLDVATLQTKIETRDSPRARAHDPWALVAVLSGVLLLNVTLAALAAALFTHSGPLVRSIAETIFSILALLLLAEVVRLSAQRAYREALDRRLGEPFLDSLAFIALSGALIFGWLEGGGEILALCGTIGVTCALVALRKLMEKRVLSAFSRSVDAVVRRGALSGQSGPKQEPSMPLAPGVLVKVRAHEEIAYDAQVVQGLCEVREESLEGGQQLRMKRPGDLLLSGSQLVRIAPFGNTAGEGERSEGEERAITVKVVALTGDGRVDPFREELMSRVAVAHRGDDGFLASQSGYALAVLLGALLSAVIAASAGASPQSLLLTFAAILLVSLVLSAAALQRVLPACIHAIAFTRGYLLRQAAVARALGTVRRLAFNFGSFDPPGEMRVARFELLDQNIDRGSLLSGIVAIAEAIDEEQRDGFESISNNQRALGADSEVVALRGLRRDLNEVALHRVQQVRWYPGRGAAATVSGFEFSLGTEEFLLERGVEFQPSEVVSTPPDRPELIPWYVAVQTDVVAWMLIAPRFSDDARDLVQAADRRNISTVVWSSESQGVLDPLAKRIGLELACLQGGLQENEIGNRLAEGEGILCYSVEPLKESEGRRAVTAAPFNRLRWDFDSADIVLFGRSLMPLLSAVELGRTFRTIERTNRILSLSVSVLLLALAGLGVLPPVAVAATILCASLALHGNALRLLWLAQTRK